MARTDTDATEDLRVSFFDFLAKGGAGEPRATFEKYIQSTECAPVELRKLGISYRSIPEKREVA
jgi:hypothetical protein